MRKSGLGSVRRSVRKTLNGVDDKTPAPKSQIMPRLEDCLDNALRPTEEWHLAQPLRFKVPIAPKHGAGSRSERKLPESSLRGRLPRVGLGLIVARVDLRRVCSWTNRRFNTKDLQFMVGNCIVLLYRDSPSCRFFQERPPLLG